MGSAILTGLLEASEKGDAPVSTFSATVRSDGSVKRLEESLKAYEKRLTISKGDIVASARDADVVLLATKPYALKEVLGAQGMGDAVRGKLLISVLAGISPALILDSLYGKDRTEKEPCHVVHATLNLGARIRQCTAVLDSTVLELPEEELRITQWVFEQIGELRYLPTNMMSVASVLAAIPAITSVAVDGMLDGCVAQGVLRSQAREITALNLISLGKLLLNGVGTEQLREQTSSPRGVTIQVLLELERQGARAAFADAFIKGTEHAKQLASIQD